MTDMHRNEICWYINWIKTFLMSHTETRLMAVVTTNGCKQHLLVWTEWPDSWGKQTYTGSVGKCQNQIA